MISKIKAPSGANIMKLLSATFEVENDLAEHYLRTSLSGMGAKYLKTFPRTEHLKEDPKYKELLKQRKQAEKNLYNYIDSRRN